MSYSIENNDPILTIRFSAQPSVTELELEVMLDELSAAKLSPLRLYIFSEGLTLTADEIRHMAIYSMNLDPQPTKLAAVCNEDLTYGISRMFEVYRRNEGVAAKAFRDEATATQWLLEGVSDG